MQVDLLVFPMCKVNPWLSLINFNFWLSLKSSLSFVDDRVCVCYILLWWPRIDGQESEFGDDTLSPLFLNWVWGPRLRLRLFGTGRGDDILSLPFFRQGTSRDMGLEDRFLSLASGVWISFPNFLSGLFQIWKLGSHPPGLRPLE